MPRGPASSWSADSRSAFTSVRPLPTWDRTRPLTLGSLPQPIAARATSKTPGCVSWDTQVPLRQAEGRSARLSHWVYVTPGPSDPERGTLAPYASDTQVCKALGLLWTPARSVSEEIIGLPDKLPEITQHRSPAALGRCCQGLLVVWALPLHPDISEYSHRVSEHCWESLSNPPSQSGSQGLGGDSCTKFYLILRLWASGGGWWRKH